jgi:predicted AAA+ superfamily ATPase
MQTISKHTAKWNLWNIHVNHLTTSNACLERIFTEKEDLLDALNEQKRLNLALKDEMDTLKYNYEKYVADRQEHVERGILV